LGAPMPIHLASGTGVFGDVCFSRVHEVGPISEDVLGYWRDSLTVLPAAYDTTNEDWSVDLTLTLETASVRLSALVIVAAWEAGFVLKPHSLRAPIGSFTPSKTPHLGMGR
jgi:hypothetical protein